MKTLVLALCLVVGATAARADDKRFALSQEEYVAGVHRYGVTDDTRVIGWQIRDDLYFGRRQGEIDDFGFIFKRGTTQYSFTQHGIGWRHAFSLH